MIANREYAQEMSQVVSYMRHQYGDNIISGRNAREGLLSMGFQQEGECEEDGMRYIKDNLFVTVHETSWLFPDESKNTGNRRFARLTFKKQGFQDYTENLSADNHPSMIPIPKLSYEPSPHPQEDTKMSA